MADQDHTTPEEVRAEAEPSVSAEAIEWPEQDEAQSEAAIDAELAKLKAEIPDVDEELAKIQAMTNQTESEIGGASSSGAPAEDADARSVFVQNVHFRARKDELEAHFSSCGQVLRSTILMDKLTGEAKGMAYVEFADYSAVPAALQLSESLFKGRQITVVPKRTNKPGMNRGRGGRGGFRGRGAQNPAAAAAAMMGALLGLGTGGPFFPTRGRGGGFRGRGRGFSPY